MTAAGPGAESQTTWKQISIATMVMAVLVFDGLDVQLLAFVAPHILKEWSIDGAAFAPAMAGALVGMAIGASFGGALGDRLGRKPLLIASTLLFGIATAMNGLSVDVMSLSVLRCAGGLGFGAAMPNGYALVTEWLPSRLSARTVALLSVSAPLGGLVGAGASLFMLPVLGWRGCFVAAGGLSVLLALVMLRWLPESPAFLLSHGRGQTALDIWSRVARGPMLSRAEPVQTTSGSESNGGNVFQRALLRLNVGGSLTFLSAAFVIYGLSSWTPTVLTTAGFDISSAIRGSLYFNLFAVVFGFAIGPLIARYGSARVMLSSCLATLAILIAIASLINLGVASWSWSARQIFLLIVGAAGGGIAAATTTIYAILTVGYPAGCRATGLGLGVTAGRVGGIATILSSGFMLRFGGRDPTGFYVALMAALVLAMVGTLIIDRHVAARKPLLGER